MPIWKIWGGVLAVLTITFIVAYVLTEGKPWMWVLLFIAAWGAVIALWWFNV
jgi:hypothetical protein